MADYIEFTVNVNEDSGVDSQSAINEKVKNTSDTPLETTKLNKQAITQMQESIDPSFNDKIDPKALKAYIKNQVVKEAVNTGIRIAENVAVQEFTYGGNTAALNRMSNTINHVKHGVSVASGMIGYATAGATMGGPVGAAIGTAIGAIFTVVDSITAYNTNKAKVEWDLQRDMLEAQMNLNRLGVSATGRGRVSFKEYRL